MVKYFLRKKLKMYSKYYFLYLDGFNQDGFNRKGFDRNGFNINGTDENSFNGKKKK